MTAKDAIIELLARLRADNILNDHDMRAIYIELQKEKGAS